MPIVCYLYYTFLSVRDKMGIYTTVTTVVYSAKSCSLAMLGSRGCH